ncbi:hypothetical protein AGMMS4957_17510 [Bacteroidia bacterium]|nr:hypothetical protein AGMMS4957_17510 [Bacteroidia bacterium]
MMKLLKLVGFFVLVLSFCGCVHDVYKAVGEPCDNVFLTLVTTDEVGNVSALPNEVEWVDIFFYEGDRLAELSVSGNPIRLKRADWVAASNVVPLSIQSGSYRVVAWANVYNKPDVDRRSWFSNTHSLSAARVLNKINEDPTNPYLYSIANQDRLYYAEPSSFTYASNAGQINIVVPSFGEKYETLSFSPATFRVEVYLDNLKELKDPTTGLPITPLVNIYKYTSSMEREGFTSELDFDNNASTGTLDVPVEYSQQVSRVSVSGVYMDAALFNLPLFDDYTTLFIEITDGVGVSAGNTTIDLRAFMGEHGVSVADGVIPIQVKYTRGKQAYVTIADWLPGGDGGSITPNL